MPSLQGRPAKPHTVPTRPHTHARTHALTLSPLCQPDHAHRSRKPTRPSPSVGPGTPVVPRPTLSPAPTPLCPPRHAHAPTLATDATGVSRHAHPWPCIPYRDEGDAAATPPTPTPALHPNPASTTPSATITLTLKHNTFPLITPITTASPAHHHHPHNNKDRLSVPLPRRRKTQDRYYGRSP